MTMQKQDHELNGCYSNNGQKMKMYKRRTRKLEPREAALMGALMATDGARRDPKISISIVRIPETWPPETYCVLGSPGQTKRPIQIGRGRYTPCQYCLFSGSSSTSTLSPSAWRRLLRGVPWGSYGFVAGSFPQAPCSVRPLGPMLCHKQPFVLPDREEILAKYWPIVKQLLAKSTIQPFSLSSGSLSCRKWPYVLL